MLSVGSSFCAGGFAGVMSFLLLHPIDVLKSCRQMQHENLTVNGNAVSSTRAIVKAGLDTDGYRFFTRGLAPSVLRAGPVSAVIFLVYEVVLSFI